MGKVMDIKNKKKKWYKILDLFSGCWGMSLGFEMAGYNVILGIDNREESLNTFKANHKKAEVCLCDLSTTSPAEIDSKFHIGKSGVDIIVWWPPCQGFSITGKRNINDPRNKLYQSFVDFVKYYQPKAFVMENVPNLIAMNDGKVKDAIIKEFNELWYNVSYKILLASDYWVPQNRRRVIFVWLMWGQDFDFPEGIYKNIESKVTAWDAISDLPENDVWDGTPYKTMPKSRYQIQMRKWSKWIFNHETVKHSEQTERIINLVPDWWNYKNLPKELQQTRKVNIARTRLNSKRPSFTIDTGHNHHFHYTFNRVPTARESARLQSFPDSFVFKGKKNDQLKQVGNAVPPLLAQAIAENLFKYL